MLSNTETQDRLNKALLEAIAIGQSARVRELLQEGADPATEDSRGLLWAASDNRTDIVQVLLDDGRADPAAHESICLQHAAEYGHTETVRLLLEDGRANPADQECYALRWASAYGHTDIVRALLIDGRADPAAGDGEPLRWAAQHGHLETIYALLEDPRVDPGADHGSALSCAAESGRSDIVHALLRDGRVDPTTEGCDALRLAAIRGNTHIVCFLLASAPDHARLGLAEELLELLVSNRLPRSVAQFLRACAGEPVMPRILDIVGALLKTDTPSGSIFALASEAARRNMSPEVVLQLHARGVLNSVLRTTLGPQGTIPKMSTIRKHGDLTALASVSKAEPMLQVVPGSQLDLGQFPNIIFELAPTLPSHVTKAIWDTLRSQVRGEEPARAYGTPAQRVRDRITANILLTAAAREYNAFIAGVKDDAYDKDPLVASAANQLLSGLNAFNEAMRHPDPAVLPLAQARIESNIEPYARLITSKENLDSRRAQRFALVHSIIRMPAEQLAELAQAQACQRPSCKRMEITL